jgi:hypothetical protein
MERVFPTKRKQIQQVKCRQKDTAVLIIIRRRQRHCSSARVIDNESPADESIFQRRSGIPYIGTFSTRPRERTMMRLFLAAAAALLLLSTHAQEPQQCLFSEEIRGIHSHLLDDSRTSEILESLKSAASDGMTVVGYIASSGASLVSNTNVIQKSLGGIESLNNYLLDTGVQEELDAVLNPRLPDNLAILGVVQKQIIGNSDRRDPLLSKDVTMKQFLDKFSLEEAGR